MREETEPGMVARASRLNTHVKGSRWRHLVELWLREQGFRTRYRAIGDPGDDITAVLGTSLELSVECKNAQRHELAAWVDQASSNAPGHAVPLLVVHRRGRSKVEDCYVVLTGAAFSRMLQALQTEEAS